MINGITSEEQICTNWKNQYYQIFNCVPSNLESITYDTHMGPENVISFSCDEVSKAINSLNTGKAADAYGI